MSDARIGDSWKSVPAPVGRQLFQTVPCGVKNSTSRFGTEDSCPLAFSSGMNGAIAALAAGLVERT